ncbi:hypothetical protein SSTU70S_07085 [Stutzerimonas stutzeri]
MIALLAGRPALLASLDGNGVDAMSQLLQRWGMRTERCLEPERLLDYLSDFSAPPLLVLQAPWPGTPGQWLEQLAAHLEANQRVPAALSTDTGTAAAHCGAAYGQPVAAAAERAVA